MTCTMHGLLSTKIDGHWCWTRKFLYKPSEKRQLCYKIVSKLSVKYGDKWIVVARDITSTIFGHKMLASSYF